jgi:hypothetical protein
MPSPLRWQTWSRRKSGCGGSDRPGTDSIPSMRDGGGGGYAVVPDVIFKASTQMLGTKEYVYAMASGVVGDLGASAGMAGDDQVAHSFAKKYEPAARTLVRGISSAGQAVGLTASKLLTMAVSYLAAEDAVAAKFTAKIDTSSFAKPPQPQCDEQSLESALPMVTGSKEVHEIPVIGKFWPQGNPDKLRAAARVWHHAADLVDDAQRNAGRHAAPIPVYCSGEAVTAFETYVKRIYAANPSGNTVVDAGQPLMENVSAGCRQMGRICDQYADAIDDCQNTLIALGVGAGIITVAGVLLTVFTFGGSDVAAAAGDAALAAEAAGAAAALAAAEAELAAAAVVAEAEAVIAAALSRLAAAGVVTAVVVGAADSASASPVLAGFPAAVPATVPPLPPGPPSGAYPPYPPQQQAAAAAWASGLQTRDPLYGKPDDIAYQVRVAGQPEREVPTGNGRMVWADGYRSDDGALVDAKHVRNLGCSPRTLQGLVENDRATGFVRGTDQDELTRYGQTIANPANHAQYLEIDTDDKATVGYWQYLAAASHVPSDVRYLP